VKAKKTTLKGSEKFLAISEKIKLVKDNLQVDIPVIDNSPN